MRRRNRSLQKAGYYIGRGPCTYSDSGFDNPDSMQAFVRHNLNSEPLARWLHEAKLGQYEETVASQGYDLELLRSLSDDEAASVAAELIPAERGADRMRLRKAVQKLRQPEPEPEPEADAA